MDFDYNSCSQFLERLDDAANASSFDDNPPQSPSSFDARSSLSPPGLSSGSVTSHSPESQRFEWDFNVNDPLFNDINGDATVGLQTNPNLWDPLVAPDQHMSDYIKIENSPAGAFDGGQPQGTISPQNAIIDQTVPTATEGIFGYPGSDKPSEAPYNFNDYYPDLNARQDSGELTSLWRNQNQMQQRDGFPSSNGWRQQPQPQQQQRQEQQQQLPSPQQPQPQPSQQSSASPLRNAVSPAASHSSPDSRGESPSDDNAPPQRTKKRKTSSDETPPDPPSSSNTTGRKPPKKTAHNMIEKRYRTNLNDKIAALRDSVPSLRIMAGTSKMGDDDDEEDLDGLAPAHKLNKATVLAKATEYIRHLEKRNKRLQEENDQLKNRLSAFEKLATMGVPMGLQPQPGQHGGRGGASGGPGGGIMSRLMVGSLAGLMVVNGLQDREGGKKDLVGIPVLEWMGIAGSSQHFQAGNQVFWLAVKLLLLFTAVAYVITPGFFDSKPATKTKDGVPQQTSVSAAPSLAAPLKDRSHAWLTAIQTIWVPRHSVALELAALGMKAIKLSLRRLIGCQRYCMLTGVTEEQELARVKAWTVALDAQLAGGDTQVNHSRLLLTLLASWTLPATPARLMLNALHIRVLFFDLGTGLQSFAEALANYYWTEARKMQEKEKEKGKEGADLLPENLAFLLQLDMARVFEPVIIQKAHDLAYNRSTSQCADGEGFDTVVKDVSIRTPLDALASWYSSLELQDVLVATLKHKVSPSIENGIQTHLETALRTAPVASAAHLRALSACAILCKETPEQHLLDAVRIFEEDLNVCTTPKAAGALKSLSNSAVTTTGDIRIAIRCGMTLALMKKGSKDATRLFADLDWRRQSSVASSMNLLGFVAAWKTLNVFVEDPDWVIAAGESVDRAAALLRTWIGDKKTPNLKVRVAMPDRRRIIEFCNALQKRVAGMDSGALGKDDGYVSGDLET